MIWPRWLARAVATLGGYFWIPCPVCGDHFAGFEASSSPMVNHRVEGGEHVSEVTCSRPACIAEAMRQQNRFYDRQHFVELSRLCRRLYDGKAVLDLADQRRFVLAALENSFDAFASVLAWPQDQTVELRIVYGRKGFGFDEVNDCMAEPPFYLWMRCELRARENLLKGDAEPLTRGANGLLDHVWI